MRLLEGLRPQKRPVLRQPDLLHREYRIAVDRPIYVREDLRPIVVANGRRDSVGVHVRHDLVARLVLVVRRQDNRRRLCPVRAVDEAVSVEVGRQVRLGRVQRFEVRLRRRVVR